MCQVPAMHYIDRYNISQFGGGKEEGGAINLGRAVVSVLVVVVLTSKWPQADES
jgi:hypothetical protein